MKQRLLVFFIVSIILFSSAVPALAQTSLADQIQAIKNQITALQTQLTQLQTQQNQGWCHTFNTNLGFSNSGSDEVTALHTVLQKEGISYGSDGSNVYAEDTAAAVVLLQGKYGILQTGYTGPLTRAKLNALYGCLANSALVAPSPLVGTSPSAESGSTLQSLNNNVSALNSATSNVSTGQKKSSPPVISYITPTSGGPGDVILVRGVNFTPGTSIKLQKDGFIYTILSNVYINETKLQMKVDNTFFVNMDAGVMYRLIASNVNGDSNSAGFILNSPSSTAPSVTVPANSLTCNGLSFANINYYAKSTTTNSNGDSLTDYCTTDSLSYNLIKGYCAFDGRVLNIAYRCPNGCSDGACLKQDTYAPTISVTSPKGGEQWQKGTTHIINWKAYEVSKVNIMIGDVTIATNIPASPGSFSWTVPTTMTSGLYAITIYDADNPSSVVATSKKISILSSVWQ